MSCNNIFYIKGTQAYALTVNENGGDSYNGTSGEVTGLHKLSNGDLIITGNFSWAGGYDHAYNFTCYKFNDGWLNVGSGYGVTANASLDPIRQSSTVDWVGYRLEIFDANLTTVTGPTYSGGSNVQIDVSANHIAYWVSYNDSFANGYWQTQ